MPHSRFAALPTFAFAAILAFFTFAPAAHAQDCADTCRIYSSCDETCEVCRREGIDGCIATRQTTCGENGICGGCGISSSRTATEQSKTGPQDGGATYCIGRSYWYGSTNWSQYQRYTTAICSVNYQTTTCNGVPGAEQEVSRSCQYGECYQFTNGSCQTGDTVLGFDIHGNECYF
ncbi:MAG: hypothetical protein QOF89_1662 [Acidobacteriota bacterium]|jgi:hypothetical protein|nr:hypothetical protein [Acidobacteriota bacterium]